MSYRDRFFQKVEKTESCWIWRGALNSKGYGAFGVHGKSVSAHRYSYEMHIGPIPKGLYICHSCDTPSCVNPEHLWAGSPSENVKDMFLKDRQGDSARRQTHCRKGHSFEEFGTYNHHRKDGRVDRICRECRRLDSIKRRKDPERREAHLKYQREYQRSYQRKKKNS